MTPCLRHIAVHAEEPHAGQFVWVLCEQADTTTWNEIRRADTACGTYEEAMADGLRALQELADDPDTGPRTRKAARTAEQNKRGADGPGDGAHREGPPHRASVFGFGPAR
ncbi:hypothetical protein [Xylophilus ampelinus]|nr:hypothetical protein [Xylophilus ampelinus]MCS4511366.1 hypothetical protein [Xylophilus ampelinus]